MKDKEINALVEKGHIHIRTIFEMAGNPKEHVENTLKSYVNTMKEDPDYVFFNEYYAPSEERDGIWSTFLETDIIVTNLEKLNVLCFNLGPASIEVIAPESFMLSQKNMNDWYNDLLSKLHEVSAILKNTTSENELFKMNLNRSIRNCVLLALTEPRSEDDLAIKVGIAKEQLQPFLTAMIKEKSITTENGKYAVNKK